MIVNGKPLPVTSITCNMTISELLPRPPKIKHPHSMVQKTGVNPHAEPWFLGAEGKMSQASQLGHG